MSKKYLKAIVTLKADKSGFDFLASTSAIDRQGDSIDQSGWELGNYKLNPVILWAHDYSQLPIGKAESVEITDAGLKISTVFASEKANPKAEQVRQLLAEGFLNAVSVGFIPKERNGNVITRAELLEVSVVPVPANQEALQLAISKGLDISLLAKDLEKGEVSDVIAEQEKREMKYEKLDSVWDIISAFCGVYCDPATPVEDFSKLLNEAITLLQGVSANGGVKADDSIVGKAINAEAKEKFFVLLSEKAGRTLSKKTLEKIGNAVNSMKSASTVLEELIKDSSTQDNEGGKGDDAGDVEPKSVVVDKDSLELLRNLLVSQDKQGETTIGLINRFLGFKK